MATFGKFKHPQNRLKKPNLTIRKVMKIAKNDPKRALTVLKPRFNIFLAQKTNKGVHLGPKTH